MRSTVFACPVDEAGVLRFNPQGGEFSAIFKGLRTMREKRENSCRRGPSFGAAATGVEMST
jgi:hypothetical protein